MWVTCFKNMVAEYISFVKQAKKKQYCKESEKHVYYKLSFHAIHGCG